LRRPVALKLLHATLEDEEQVRRFQQEARVTSRLQHPGVVTLFDFGVCQQSHQPWIAYEFIEGQDLASLPPGHPWLHPEHLAEVGALIAEALDAAHQLGVVHRDVKPANVLLRETGEPVLCDFGIARLDEGASVRTAEGILLGTPAFMSPELWKGTAPSPASDQYAWAATLYQLLYGQTVFGVEEPYEILRALESGQRVRIPSSHAGAYGLEQALLRALSPLPRLRYPGMQDFAQALRGQPQTSPPASGQDALAQNQTQVVDREAITRQSQVATLGTTRQLSVPSAADPKSGAPPQRGRLLPFLVLIPLILAGLHWFSPSFPAAVAPSSPVSTPGPQALPPQLRETSLAMQELLGEDLTAPIEERPKFAKLQAIYPKLVTLAFRDLWIKLLRRTGRWIEDTPAHQQGPWFQAQVQRILGHQAYQSAIYIKRFSQRIEKTASGIKALREIVGTEDKKEDLLRASTWEDAAVWEQYEFMLKRIDLLIQKLVATHLPESPPSWLLRPLLELGSLFNLPSMATFLEPVHEHLLKVQNSEDLLRFGRLQYLILRRIHDRGLIPSSLRRKVLFETQDYLENPSYEIPEKIYVELQARGFEQLLTTPFLYHGEDFPELRGRIPSILELLKALLPDHPATITQFAYEASRAQAKNVIVQIPGMAPWIEEARILAEEGRKLLPTP
jgi:serine/threonine protein kinase